MKKTKLSQIPVKTFSPGTDNYVMNSPMGPVQIDKSGMHNPLYTKMSPLGPANSLNVLDINTKLLRSTVAFHLFIEIRINGYSSISPHVIYIALYPVSNTVTQFKTTKVGSSDFQVGWYIDSNDIIHVVLARTLNYARFIVSSNYDVPDMTITSSIPAGATMENI